MEEMFYGTKKNKKKTNEGESESAELGSFKHWTPNTIHKLITRVVIWSQCIQSFSIFMRSVGKPHSVLPVLSIMSSLASLLPPKL